MKHFCVCQHRDWAAKICCIGSTDVKNMEFSNNLQRKFYRSSGLNVLYKSLSKDINVKLCTWVEVLWFGFMFLLLQQLQWGQRLRWLLLVSLACPSLPQYWVLISLPPLVFQGSDPTAFSVLTQAITGQVGFVDAEFCTTCGGKGADKRCSVCKMVRIRKIVPLRCWGFWMLSYLLCRLRRNGMHACTESI